MDGAGGLADRHWIYARIRQPNAGRFARSSGPLFDAFQRGKLAALVVTMLKDDIRLLLPHRSPLAAPPRTTRSTWI